MPLCEDIAPFSGKEFKKHLAWGWENLFNTAWLAYVHVLLFMFLWKCQSMWMHERV